MSSYCQAQQPGWLWGVNGSNADDDAATSVTHDKQGNIYVAGSFKGVQILGNDTLISRGDNDVFLVKYAPDGQVIWARSGGSVAGESVSAIATDSSGNVYLTGHFGYHIIYPTTITDTAFFSEDTIVSNGNIDIYLAKYDSTGNIVWLNGYGSNYNDDYGLCLAINNSQKLIFSGSFNNAGFIYFGNSIIDGSLGSMLMIKMDQNANIEILKQYKSSCTSISYDKYDNIYAYGYIGNNTDFDGLIAANVSSGFVGGGGFLVKFNSNLNAQWVNSIGGINNGSSNAGVVIPTFIRTTLDGNFYIAGSYANCGLVFPNITTLPNKGAFEIFLAKYDTWGNLQWAKSMGGLSDDGPPFIYLDEQEHCYVTGYVRYQAFFDQDTVTCYGVNDVFLAQYDKNGKANWAVNMGGTGNEAAMAIDGSPDGSIYLAGSFSSDYFNYQSNNIQNSGGSDFFLVKLSKPNGINNMPNDQQELKIYPNPAKDVVQIKAQQAFDEISLTDALGRTILKQSFSSPEFQASIDISALPNNCYYLHFFNKQQHFGAKMIVVNH